MGMLLCVPMALIGIAYIVLAARGVTQPRPEQAETVRADAA